MNSFVLASKLLNAQLTSNSFTNQLSSSVFAFALWSAQITRNGRLFLDWEGANKYVSKKHTAASKRSRGNTPFCNRNSTFPNGRFSMIYCYMLRRQLNDLQLTLGPKLIRKQHLNAVWALDSNIISRTAILVHPHVDTPQRPHRLGLSHWRRP